MEEKKTKTMKVSAAKGGKSVKGTDDKQQKLTYEQLNDACTQLFQQNQQLYQKIEELNTYNAFKRLDYLFRILDSNSAAIKVDAVTFDQVFVENCIKEIQDAMTPSEEQKK